MQKLSGTSSGKNNKSCRIFHNESNKIEYAFVRFFYDFLRILQDSGRQQYYLRFTFAPGSRENFRFLQICPYFAAEPLEITGGSQLGPPGRPAAVPTEIRRAGSEGRPGKVGRMTRDSPATGLGAWLESGSHRQGHTTAQPGCGRREPCSGEAAARWEEGASRRATSSAGARARGITWLHECT
jgi:hypothetical protein